MRRVLGEGYWSVRGILFEGVTGEEWDDKVRVWEEERKGVIEEMTCRKGEEEVLVEGEFKVRFCRKYDHHSNVGGEGVGGKSDESEL